MNTLRTIALCAALCLSLTAGAVAAGAPRPPNIVYILADDLGYGDVRCYNPNGKIPTPHIDRLAAQGMRFTDVHSGSSVCSPTRYGIMTGRYAWRTTLQNGVLWGYSRRLIEPGRLTLPAMLKARGYRTACFGKWHLGMDWPLKAGGIAAADKDKWAVDYAGKIANGPTTVGFETLFGISGSLDMFPFVWIADDRCAQPATVEKHIWRDGPAAVDFEAVDVLPTLTKRACDYLAARSQPSEPRPPFFLYLPLASPHTPIAVAPEWQGKSGLNAYADFVMQTDAAVGQVLDSLERAGQAENTLVILTSDNGCSNQANLPELLAKGHNPSGPFRGLKMDAFEGGHRVPFVARWPGQVKPGTTSAQTICLTDLVATCAEILGEKFPANAAEDSVSFLPALLGTDAGRPLREATVHHSMNGSFAIRQANWKLIFAPGSGGWSAPKPGSPAERGLPPVQLYDLAADVGEQHNVHAEHPDVVARLTKLMEQYVADGRSTPGAPQRNALDVVVRKQPKGRP